MSHCNDYCCNYGCDQGRDCPARVAPVGRGIRAQDPLPPSPWRNQLRHLAKWMLAVICLLFYAGLLSAVLRGAA